MTLQFFCPRWGSEHLVWDDFLCRVKDAGYDGVEWAIERNTSPIMIEDVADQMQRKGLVLIPQHYDTTVADFDEHVDQYIEWFEKIKSLKVAKINSQTGKDFFSIDQNKILIGVADEFTSETAILVCHETHRNKFSFAAHITKQYLAELPNLKITLDASHWVNVAESYLYDQAGAMQIAIERTEHLHARIGYPEGPQVMDPRDPLWKEALDVHLAWWDKVVERKLNNDTSNGLTITTEFGPFPYMINIPYSTQPIANQWEINVAMMNMLRKRYNSMPSSASHTFHQQTNFVNG